MVGKIYFLGRDKALLSKDGKHIIFKDGTVVPLKNAFVVKNDSIVQSKDSVKGVMVSSDRKYIIKKDGSKIPIKIEDEK